MKKVLYSSQYILPEWISAHSLKPVKEISNLSGNFEGEGEGICPYAEMMYRNSLLEDIDAAVFTTRCDQMRRVSELLKNSGKECFLVNIPSTWKNPVSVEIYKDELQRLNRFLTGVSGKKFSLKIFKQELMKKANINKECNSGKRIALMGGPMTAADSGFIKLLESNGASIALDAREQGEMSEPDINFPKLEKDLFAELANLCFKDVPDIAKRPNTQFYEKTAELIKDRGIEGIILRLYPWCDLWHAETQRIKEHFDLPLLQVAADLNMEPEKDKRLQTRIKAFLEMM